MYIALAAAISVIAHAHCWSNQSLADTGSLSNSMLPRALICTLHVLRLLQVTMH